MKDRLIVGNNLFKNKIANSSKLKETIKKQIDGQSPYALIITCSDSRVVPEEIFSASLGELFVVRTAGNVINEGELASVEYGIRHLNIKYVLVLAHTHCGAIHAAIHHEKGQYLSPILDNISRNIALEKDEYKASCINAIKQADFLKEKFPDFDGIIEAGIYNIEDNSFSFIGE